MRSESAPEADVALKLRAVAFMKTSLRSWEGLRAMILIQLQPTADNCKGQRCLLLVESASFADLQQPTFFGLATAKRSFGPLSANRRFDGRDSWDRKHNTSPPACASASPAAIRMTYCTERSIGVSRFSAEIPYARSRHCILSFPVRTTLA